jgi:hypothetical protein
MAQRKSYRDWSEAQEIFLRLHYRYMPWPDLILELASRGKYRGRTAILSKAQREKLKRKHFGSKHPRRPNPAKTSQTMKQLWDKIKRFEAAGRAINFTKLRSKRRKTQVFQHKPATIEVL